MDTQTRDRSFRLDGLCPACGSQTTFEASDSWYRDYLICPNCPGGSVPRERALALVLNEIRPNWRELAIHESSPSNTGASVIFARDGKNYIASQYFPDAPFGTVVAGVRNENLEQQTFADSAFDIVITMDVMEHVYHADRVVSEIYRTLKPGGVYICTFPVRNDQVDGWKRRFILNKDGSRTDLETPEIHGNPVDNQGSIVTIDYGYNLHKAIAEWAPFDVRVSRFHDAYHGILGEFTEVVVCSKLSGEYHATAAELADLRAAEINSLKRRVDRLECQAAEMKVSTSWRITAPLRAVGNQLRRLKLSISR